ncbi:acyl-CoA oxidase domain protein [Mycobacterium xenopi 3993]|nr:acyl-CoA oxidase domain protein [Mycobacterium xenopi 3993]
MKKIINLELRGLFRDDRDRPRQRCAVAGDDGHLRRRDPEFVIDSPTPTARKDYIGGAAKPLPSQRYSRN